MSTGSHACHALTLILGAIHAPLHPMSKPDSDAFGRQETFDARATKNDNEIHQPIVLDGVRYHRLNATYRPMLTTFWSVPLPVDRPLPGGPVYKRGATLTTSLESSYDGDSHRFRGASY